MSVTERISIIGAGRMGEGIATAFAFAGVPVSLVDIKNRTALEQQTYFENIMANIHNDLNAKVMLGRLREEQVSQVADRVKLVSRGDAKEPLRNTSVTFEAVPEIVEVKRETFAWLDQILPADSVIASTTSTFLVTQLADLVQNGERFLNAHWLNPADLVPLVEISKSCSTDQDALNRLLALLKSIGKVPVVCTDSPGYIVPRLQTLVMNEAARMVEEGAARAEDIDTAVRLGFGFRFGILGMLEFLDWGGGDILHYASDYLSGELGERYEAPAIIASNMDENRRGMRDGQGFYKYDHGTVEAYKREKISEFWRQLDNIGLAPKLNAAQSLSIDSAL